jgi:hypothetical protein
MQTGMSLFEPRYLRVYSVLTVGAVALWLVELVFRPGFAVELVLAAVVSVAVFSLTRSELRIGGTFPELMRIPFARWLFGGGDKTDE